MLAEPETSYTRTMCRCEGSCEEMPASACTSDANVLKALSLPHALLQHLPTAAKGINMLNTRLQDSVCRKEVEGFIPCVYAGW